MAVLLARRAARRILVDSQDCQSITNEIDMIRDCESSHIVQYLGCLLVKPYLNVSFGPRACRTRRQRRVPRRVVTGSFRGGGARRAAWRRRAPSGLGVRCLFG